MLGIERLFGVKKGMNPLELSSSEEDEMLAVNPIDYTPSVGHSTFKAGDKLTPFVIRRLMIPSSPTNAPLSINRTLEVSMEYESGLANVFQLESYSCPVNDIHSPPTLALRGPGLERPSPPSGGASFPPFAWIVTTDPSIIR